MNGIFQLFAGSAVIAAAVFSCGCSLLSEPRQTRIAYYDLKPPEKLSSLPVEVEQFVTFSGERQRMLRRKHDTSVVSSDFNKWMQSPGSLLTRYLRLTFRRNLSDPSYSGEQAVVIRGEVLIFEICGGNAVLGVRYQLKYDRQTYSKTVVIKEKMSSDCAEAFAEAMSKAASRFAGTVAAEIGKLCGKGK